MSKAAGLTKASFDIKSASRVVATRLEAPSLAEEVCAANLLAPSFRWNVNQKAGLRSLDHKGLLK